MENHQERLEGLTIVDILNEDCWRAILDLLHIKEVIQLERVSRQWQHVVFQYLQGARFSIEYPWYKHETQSKCCVITMDNDDPEKFDRITRKWGPYIKTTDCVNRASLKVLRRNCPNLEDITFYGLQNDILLNAHSMPKNYKNLKRMHFRSCEISDKCISRWLTRDTIEELAISDSQVTGQCLTSLQSTRLKSLRLRECETLDFQHFLSATDHLTGLTKLELAYIPKDIFQNVHLLLDKMPNLEDLCLWWLKRMELGSELIESVGRLRRLKRLDLSFNPNVTDEWLETIARGCRLQELLLEGCLGQWAGASPDGVLAVCRASGAALRVLGVGSSSGKLLDRHVAAFLTTCPNLTSLDVSYCYGITEELAGVAAAARGRRLRLKVENTTLEGCHVKEPNSEGKLQVGDLVVVEDGALPPPLWAAGRVLRIIPGADGALRIADVRLRRGVVRREFGDLYLMEDFKLLNAGDATNY